MNQKSNCAVFRRRGERGSVQRLLIQKRSNIEMPNLPILWIDSASVALDSQGGNMKLKTTQMKAQMQKKRRECPFWVRSKVHVRMRIRNFGQTPSIRRQDENAQRLVYMQGVFMGD